MSDDRPRFEAEVREAVRARLPRPDAGFEARLLASIDRAGSETLSRAPVHGLVAVAAAALALVCVAILLIVRLSAGLGHSHDSTPARARASQVASPSPMPSPTPTPDAGAAVVVGDATNPNQLQRVDYAGNRLGAAWRLDLGRPGAQPIVPGVIDSVDSVSPDGRYVGTLGGSGVVVMDVQGRTITPPSFTSGSYAWADDSRHLCQWAAGTSGSPQLLIADVTGSPPAVRSVPISGLQDPEPARAVRCSIAGDRAVLVVGATPQPGKPATGSGTAVVVRLSTGQVVSRVSMGDGNAVFSLDGRYMALPDASQGTSAIVDLSTGATLAVEHRAVEGFSADDSRVVENSLFFLQGGGRGGVGQTFVVDWRSGQVLFARSGWALGVREQPGSADVAVWVELTNPAGELGGPTDLVIVPAAAPPIVIPGLYGY